MLSWSRRVWSSTGRSSARRRAGRRTGPGRQIRLPRGPQPLGCVPGEPGPQFGDSGGLVLRLPPGERPVVADQVVQPGAGATDEVGVGDGTGRPPVEQRGDRAQDRGAGLEDVLGAVRRLGRREHVLPPGEHERLDGRGLLGRPGSPVHPAEPVRSPADVVQSAVRHRVRALGQQAPHDGGVVLEVAGHLVDEAAQQLRREPGAGRAQIRRLLRCVTALAAGLRGAGEAVEDGVDVRERGGEGGRGQGSRAPSGTPCAAPGPAEGADAISRKSARSTRFPSGQWSR